MPIVGQSFSPHKVFQGYFLPDSLMDYRGISYGSKMLLMILYRMIGKNDYAWPSQEYLADKLGVSDRSIRSYLSELEQNGFIESDQRGLGQTNMYRTTWHPIYEDEDDPSGQVRNDASGADRKISSGPSYKTEENQKASESSETPFPSFPSLRSDDSQITYQQANGILEKTFGRKLTSKERRQLLQAESYGSSEEECIALARAAGIVDSGKRRIEYSYERKEPFASIRQSIRQSSSNVDAPSETWLTDTEYQAYLAALGASGKRIDPRYADNGFRLHWERLNAQERASCVEDAAHLAKIREDKPEMVPNPEAHLASKPWLAMRGKSKVSAGSRTPEEKAAAIARLREEVKRRQEWGKV